MTVTDENRIAPIVEALDLGLIEDDEPSTSSAPSPDDDEAPSAAKRGPGRPRKSQPTVKKRNPLPQWKNGAIAAFVTQIYMLGGSTLQGSRNERMQQYGECAVTIAEPAGIVWEKLAKRHEALRRFFDKMMQGSELTELLMVHAPLFVMALSDMGLLRMPNLAKEFEEEMADL